MLFDTAAGRLDAVPVSCPFRDVAAGHPNIEAITWAQENGYLCGYGKGLFGPEDCMTVEQAMMMFYRFSKGPKADQTVLNRYKDCGMISTWARNAVSWAVTGGMFRSDGIVSPQAAITEEWLFDCLGKIVMPS